MKQFKPEDLSRFNGKDGNPAYVARGGKVYDVSGSRFWKNGRHMNRHESGRDLTADIHAAPHGTEVLERVPCVGELTGKEIRPPLPLFPDLIDRFPILRRHPHPMTVHFPLVFMVFTPVFHILFLATGVQTFESTSFHILGAGILTLPVAMFTGFVTWQLNYGRPLRPVTIKLIVSIILLVASAGAFIWRFIDPAVYTRSDAAGILYLILLLALAPLVVVIGWYGAQLTFPLSRD